MTRKKPATRKGRPTAEAGRRKLTQVLAVASEQFCELGYRAVTMRGVADKAGVSTRTLYNRYSDKLSLFRACLDFESRAFPVPCQEPGDTPEDVLERYAAAIVRELSLDSSLRLGMLVYREGPEFPELLRAAEAHEHRVLIQPLVAYLRTIGVEREHDDELSKLFLAMALSQWQRQGSYRRPPPGPDEIRRHAALAARTFLNGVRSLAGGKDKVLRKPRPGDCT